MTLFNLLYASRSTIPSDEVDAAVDALVDVGKSRNESAGVTGCLIFGGDRFAQMLEGDQMAVKEIMRSICSDPRHSDIIVLCQGFISARRFGGWTLGYAGPSLFIQRTIAAAVSQAPSGSTAGISDLLRVMTGFRSEELARVPPLAS